MYLTSKSKSSHAYKFAAVLVVLILAGLFTAIYLIL